MRLSARRQIWHEPGLSCGGWKRCGGRYEVFMSLLGCWSKQNQAKYSSYPLSSYAHTDTHTDTLQLVRFRRCWGPRRPAGLYLRTQREDVQSVYHHHHHHQRASRRAPATHLPAAPDWLRLQCWRGSPYLLCSTWRSRWPCRPHLDETFTTTSLRAQRTRTGTFMTSWQFSLTNFQDFKLYRTKMFINISGFYFLQSLTEVVSLCSYSFSSKNYI